MPFLMPSTNPHQPQQPLKPRHPGNHWANAAPRQ